MKIKTYEAMFNPEHVKGVFGISLVENPAMQGHFVALSEDEKKAQVQLKTIDEEERILIGLVLEPNKPVYRSNDGEEYYLTFSEKTVKELAHHFYKASFHQNSSLEHADKIVGVTFVESWIVADPEKDKSAVVGLSHPKGSWIATMKVDSEEVWNDYVKTGRVQGFSVDAMIGLKEVELKSDIKMSKEKDENKSMVDAFITGLSEFFKGKKLVELGEIKSANDDVAIFFEGDTMEIGGRAWIVAEDGTEVPLPVGEYPLEDGKILVVSEEGKIGELKEATPSDPAAPAAPEEETLTGEQAKKVSDAVASTIKSIMIKYGEEVGAKIEAKYTAKLAAMETENAEMKKQIEQFAEAPAAKPKKVVPEQKEATNAKQRLFNHLQETN